MILHSLTRKSSSLSEIWKVKSGPTEIWNLSYFFGTWKNHFIREDKMLMDSHLYNSSRSCSWVCLFPFCVGIILHLSFCYCTLVLRFFIISMAVLLVNLQVLFASIMFATHCTWELPFLFRTQRKFSVFPFAEVPVWAQGSLWTIELSTVWTFEWQDGVIRWGS